MTHEEAECPGCPACMGPPDPLGWTSFTPRDSDNGRIPVHAIPDNDVGKHLIDRIGECGCHPYVDADADELIFVHNAFDKRELYAQQLLKPH